MKTIKKITLGALFAAIITVFTAYICHVPIGINGGYVHLGDAFIYIAASLLPLPYAILAAAVGAGLADLLTAPVWFLASVIIKSLICLSFTNKKIICKRNIFACVLGVFITVLGYAVAEYIIFGSFAGILYSVVGNLIQATASGVLFILIGFYIEKIRINDIIKL